MAHAHHHRSSADTNARRLALTLGLGLRYMGVEIVGGLMAHSLGAVGEIRRSTPPSTAWNTAS